MGTETWGTWEELLLGGAVLRHGTRDWNLVASELRTRTVAPFGFTPEICKAKYEDLQQRYSGCKAWFEELRKQRMAELRQALEKTEDSIGSLESKVEGLKAEKRDDSQVIYGSSQTESAIPCLNSEGIEFSSKDKCKDGLSASSFTQEAETNWPPHCQIPVAVPAEVMDVKQGDSLTSEREQSSSIDKLVDTFCGGRFLSIRKRRGKRKRKDCSKNAKEGSVGESEFLGPADVANASWCKETSASSEDQNRGSSGEVIDDIMGIFSSIAKNDCTSVFRRRLDSQERGRYKKMIRQHRDFDTIRSRIASKSILSVKELFRDMLLVANNALVFYSKNTREYKSALLLRHIVTATLQQHLKEYRSKAPLHKPLAKPRSIHPSHHERLGNTANNETPVVVNSRGCKNTSNAESPPQWNPQRFQPSQEMRAVDTLFKSPKVQQKEERGLELVDHVVKCMLIFLDLLNAVVGQLSNIKLFDLQACGLAFSFFTLMRPFQVDLSSLGLPTQMLDFGYRLRRNFNKINSGFIGR